MLLLPSRCPHPKEPHHSDRSGGALGGLCPADPWPQDRGSALLFRDGHKPAVQLRPCPRLNCLADPTAVRFSFLLPLHDSAADECTKFGPPPRGRTCSGHVFAKRSVKRKKAWMAGTRSDHGNRGLCFARYKQPVSLNRTAVRRSQESSAVVNRGEATCSICGDNPDPRRNSCSFQLMA